MDMQASHWRSGKTFPFALVCNNCALIAWHMDQKKYLTHDVHIMFSWTIFFFSTGTSSSLYYHFLLLSEKERKREGSYLHGRSGLVNRYCSTSHDHCLHPADVCVLVVNNQMHCSFGHVMYSPLTTQVFYILQCNPKVLNLCFNIFFFFAFSLFIHLLFILNYRSVCNTAFQCWPW